MAKADSKMHASCKVLIESTFSGHILSKYFKLNQTKLTFHTMYIIDSQIGLTF